MKNFYENIEEIKIIYFVLIEIFGDWYCIVKILFNDKKFIVYNIIYNLELKKNYSGKFNEKNMNFFDLRIGKIKKIIKIIFLDG